jgi:hypothetical protein
LGCGAGKPGSSPPGGSCRGKIIDWGLMRSEMERSLLLWDDFRIYAIIWIMSYR